MISFINTPDEQRRVIWQNCGGGICVHHHIRKDVKIRHFTLAGEVLYAIISAENGIVSIMYLKVF